MAYWLTRLTAGRARRRRYRFDNTGPGDWQRARSVLEHRQLKYSNLYLKGSTPMNLYRTLMNLYTKLSIRQKITAVFALAMVIYSPLIVLGLVLAH